MTWAILMTGAGMLAAIVTLALIAVRAHRREVAAVKAAGKADREARIADAERIDAARRRVVAELELSTAQERVLALEAENAAMDAASKELYEELRRRGVPGASAHLDALMRRMQSFQTRRKAGAESGRRAGSSVPDPRARSPK